MDGARENLSAIVAAGRAFPAAVADLEGIGFGMKTILGMVAVLFVCESFSLCSAGDSGLTWNLKGSSPGGSIYQFDVRMGEKDRWDSGSQKTPPLEPGKAIQLANQFMQKVPLGGAWKAWRLDKVEMLRSLGPEGHEEWLYVVRFYASIPGTLTTGGPDMSVPVRMNGTIPEPSISKPKS